MSTPDPEATARLDSDVPYTRRRGPDAQFAPGTVVAGRYRIASILGSGGMGEVYRADDTKLGQTVALKFLPARLARDPILLDRLHDEVRLGRQVAHPNVCHIYDIVDWDGAHFVAMEYVDGEDLSRLLKRIGRLAHDKAVDIARGIAAGLAAAHAKGILHRDLKPANIMIDSRGEARVMDFGLALAAGEDDGTVSGTPAYMAPELLEGHAATVQSDLYALGLVMYELFTGRRAHSARTMPERVHELSSVITTPSDVVRDIDPAVERVILRCVANDPAQRPRSAREVIHALPGGDPLAAALAAGETPSPRAVAAAGSEGSLKPAVAWALLIPILAGFAFFALRTMHSAYWQRAGLTRPPEVEAERASELLRRLGVPAQPFRTYGFREDHKQMLWATEHDPARLQRADGIALVRFWMREERAPLLRYGLMRTPEPELDDPPQHAPGSVALQTDLRGRILSLTALAAPDWKPRPLDWSALLRAAGLDRAQLTPVAPQILPPSFADARAAWTGRHPDDGTPIRVEAAAFRGVPVLLRVAAPWDAATAVDPFTRGGAFYVFGMTLFVAAAAAASGMASRNLRQRRGDRQGGLRIAATLFILTFCGHWTLADHQPALLHELAVFAVAAADALLYGALVWLIYIALEPYIRRRWPQGLISWARLISGNWRDPMIARDVLIGLLVGMVHAILASGLLIPTSWTLPFARGAAHHFNDALQPFAVISSALAEGMLQGLFFMVVLMLLLIVLRRHALAAAGIFALTMTAYSFVSTEAPFLVTFTILAALMALVICRYGLLATIAAQAVFRGVFDFVMPDALAWYTVRAAIPSLFFILLAIWAFRTSLAGQRAFAVSLDE